jgi:hypothetical protein
MSPLMAIPKNANALAKRVHGAYNERQSRYREDRDPCDPPIEIYGYQSVGASAGFHSGPPGRRLVFTFRVKPMPYAYDDSPDRGLNQTACDAITRDLRRAIFKWSPRLSTENAAAATRDLLAWLLNQEREAPLEVPEMHVDLVVNLRRSARGPCFASTLPLDDERLRPSPGHVSWF